MKTFTLLFSALLFTFFSYSQCPTISGTLIHTPASDHYTLQITFVPNVQNFHIEDSIFCNGVLISSGCNTFDVTGTLNIEFDCSGTPLAKVNPFLAPCGNEEFPCAAVIVEPAEGPTPVVLSDFGVQRNGNNVITKWRTEQEINSDHFVIERSTDNNRTFQEVAQVNSHVNSSTPNTYTFVDKTNTYKGISFYRIKLVDRDGSITFTNAKTVKGLLRNVQDFVIYPNPSFGNAKITITGLNEPSVIQVIDNIGRIVKSEILINNNVVEINKLQKGSYIIKMTGKESGATLARKLNVIN